MADKVRVYHELMGRDIEIDADIVLLTTPLIPGEDNQRISRMMRIPIGNDGFFLEAHQKLRPVEFPSDGIYIAGCARYPTDIGECISQGYAAAAKAAIPMARGKVVSDAFVSEVNPMRCSACGRCVDICPFGAVDWTDWKDLHGETRSVASVMAQDVARGTRPVWKGGSAAAAVRGESDCHPVALSERQSIPPMYLR